MRKYVNLPRRDVEGVLLIDKPKNISSSFLLNKIKTLFHANKAGHTGTLDMLATGMLPVCFGKATKLAKYLLNFDKRYKVIAQLGVSTDTFDAFGKVIRVTSVIDVSINELKRCLNSFIGKSYQIPPMFSSLKYYGVPLYKYARKNVEVPRNSREIFIYNLNLLEINKENIIKLIIHCSKGTYVRSMINDLGECLKCGAHVVELRRLSVGNWLSTSMIQIKTLESIFNNNFLSDMEVLEKLDTLLIPINIVKSLYCN